MLMMQEQHQKINQVINPNGNNRLTVLLASNLCKGHKPRTVLTSQRGLTVFLDPIMRQKGLLYN